MMSTEAVLRRFNDVFLSHDPAALSDLVAADCVIGRAACIALWTEIATTPGTFFELEDVTVLGEQCIIPWRYHWGEGGSVRGVNLMRVHDGLIVEAQRYVKGGGH